MHRFQQRYNIYIYIHYNIQYIDIDGIERYLVEVRRIVVDKRGVCKRI